MSCQAFKEKWRMVFPKYSGIPLLSVLFFNMITYYGTQLIAGNFQHHDITVPLDDKIPFLSIFIVPYIVAYLQWGIGYIVIARESKEHCFRILYGEIIAKALVFITFIVFPTTMVRPELHGSGLFYWLTEMIYNADTPVNLFPSIHCLESIFVFFGCLKMKTVGNWYKWTMGIISLLVCLSTVFVKQHVVLDIAGAAVYFAVGLSISSMIFRKK